MILIETVRLIILTSFLTYCVSRSRPSRRKETEPNRETR